MRLLLSILILALCLPASAQTQKSGVSWPGGYYINGPLSVNMGRDIYPDVSALLQIGRDTSNKATILSKGFVDSLLNPNNKLGLFIYDLRDSVLYHVDGNKKVRYMTYKDTSIVATKSFARNPANITQSSSYRFTTDAEKTTWNAKEPAVTAGTTNDYYRGDKTWQATSSLPISTATQTALNNKVTIGGDAPASPLREGTTNAQPVVLITNNITRDSFAANGARTIFSPTTNGFDFFTARSLSNEQLFRWTHNTADVKLTVGISDPQAIITAIAKSSGVSSITYPSNTRHTSAGLYGIFPTGALILGPSANQPIEMRSGGEAGTLRLKMHTDGKIGVGSAATTNGGINQFQVGDGLRTDGLTIGYAAKTTNYTATNNDYFLAVDATAGDVTIALPTTGIIAGKVYEVFKTNTTNNVILDPAGGVTINGAATVTLSSQYQFKGVLWTGTEYFINKTN